MDWIIKAIDATKSLKLWFFTAIACVGFAALYLPPFGGADLTIIRNNSWMAWLAAVSGTIFSTAKLIDVGVTAWRIASNQKASQIKRILTNRYSYVYAPLAAKFATLHITRVSGRGAPTLKHRLKNALSELNYYERRTVGIKRAWRALFDQKVLPSIGEMDFGGEFPIAFFQDILRTHSRECDETFIVLVRSAVETRINQGVPENILSEDDCLLMDHVRKEHDRLKKLLRR